MDFNDASVFITGANGFVGRKLTAYLLQKSNARLFLLHRNIDTFHAHHPKEFEDRMIPVIADINHIDNYQDIIGKVDYIFHLAAQISFAKRGYEHMYNTNVLGTRKLLDVALLHRKSIKAFMFMSSIGAIRRSSLDEIVADEDFDYNWDALVEPSYQYTKYLSEKDVVQSAKNGLNAYIVNPSVIMGSGGNNKALLSLFSIAKSRIFIKPKGGINIVHVYDVIQGMIKVLEKGNTGERYILSGDNVTYRDIIRYLNTLNKTKTFFIGPGAILVKLIPKLIKLYTFSYFSNAKAKSKLNWDTMYSWRESLGETNSYLNNNKLI